MKPGRAKQKNKYNTAQRMFLTGNLFVRYFLYNFRKAVIFKAKKNDGGKQKREKGAVALEKLLSATDPFVWLQFFLMAPSLLYLSFIHS